MILFAFALIHGITTFCTPFLKYLGLYYVNGVVKGFVGAALGTGGNALCLDTWSKDEVGPWMHSVHFSYAIGAFVGPLIAMPFLGHKLSNSTESTVSQNATSIEDIENDAQITTLYSLVGSIAIICSFGYLAIAMNVKHFKTSKVSRSETDVTEVEEKYRCKHWIMIILMGMFYFFYVGSDCVHFHYLAVFSVMSSLGMDKQGGAKVSAIFTSSFAISRFCGIFTSMKLKPIHNLLISFGIAWTSILVLMLFGDQNEIVLKIAVASLAFGFAPMYATGKSTISFCINFVIDNYTSCFPRFCLDERIHESHQ